MQQNRRLLELTRYGVYDSYMEQRKSVKIVIDIPEKKIYLNRAADQAANVVQVRFSRYEFRKPGLRLPWLR